MYPDEELPQIIGQDIVLLLLNMFKIFPNLKYLMFQSESATTRSERVPTPTTCTSTSSSERT